MTLRIRGFTLIELLLVIIILGIVTAVTIPIIGAGTSGAQLGIGARNLLQASRYARTMALLHQAPTVLSIGLNDGTLRVEAAQASGENRVMAEASSLDDVAARQGQEAGSNSFFTEEADALNDASNRPAAALTAQNFADEVRAEYSCKGVKFRFLGYRDKAGVELLEEQKGASTESDDRNARVEIVYNGNGTCRPFRVRAWRDEDEWLDVEVNVTGLGRVLEGHD